MILKEITDKDVWDSFVVSQKDYTFVQSWGWGEFNKATGDNLFRLGVYEGETLIAVAMAIKVHARRGNFLFVPHGPIIIQHETYNMKHILEVFTKKLQEIASAEKDIVFIRVSPLLHDDKEAPTPEGQGPDRDKRVGKNKKLFKELGFKDAPIYMHAETTWTLNLDGEEKDLMMGMRKNTRNLVRRAEKEGVTVESGTSKEYIDEFYKLYEGTAEAQGFVPFSKKYIKEELEAFNDNTSTQNAKIYLAKWQGQVLSTALIVSYGNSAFYHHGANSTENRKIPAAYLLQWRAMLEAKGEGRTRYNFWGIAKDDENKNHPWYGLSFFKKGFGGYRTDYVHAQDMPLSWRYIINYAVEKIRLIKRGV